MGSPETASRIAIEVFAKYDQVFPIRVGSVTFFPAMAGPVAILSGEKEIHQTPCEVLGDLDEGALLPAASGVFEPEIVSIYQRITLQRINQQHVHREPNWAAPITVAAEHAAVSLRRRVTNSEALAGEFYFKRIVMMMSRQ